MPRSAPLTGPGALGFALAAAALPWMLAFDQRGAAELCAWVLALFRLWTWRRGLTPDRLGFTLLGLWLWLNVWVSPLALDPAASFGRSLPWLRFPLLFLALRDLLPLQPKALRWLSLSLMTCLAFVVVDGLWQLIHGISLSGQPMAGDRLTGPLDRPNIGMLTTRLGLPLLALLAWALPPSGRSQVLLACGALGLLGFVLLTGERSASLLLLGALGVALAGSIRQGRQHQLVGVLALVALMTVAVGIWSSSPRIQQRVAATVTALADFPASPYGKIIGAGLTLGWDDPWSGAGLKGFRIGCPALEAAGRVSACEAHPHQFLVEWFAEAGLPALFGFLFAVGFLLRTITGLSADPGRRVRPWALAAWLVVLFPLQIGQSFFSNWPGLLAWTSLGLTAAVVVLARPKSV